RRTRGSAKAKPVEETGEVDEVEEVDEPDEKPLPDGQDHATKLLVRAMRVALEKSEDEWLNSGGVKSQMQRMNSSFKEKALGYSSFRAFIESRADVVESRTAGQQVQLRLK
ncbi:MAG: hypothetical protein JWO46_1069, partial [Nocardioidaceae bacterium]|nr:hypothetical protein [Nocardioidaceae bacterium]